MKNSQVRKSVVIGALLVAGLGAAQAQTQTDYQAETGAPVASYATAADSTGAGDSQNHRSAVVIRSGYNVGRTAVQNVPGCDGPASFCNMYFGN
ncbi:hypothetical protein [Paraburkholderia phytofirmans]|uniref:hypothetical protein n=1 Tax=Paraburkholderia TaxID=1822464 RepID=UPI0011DFD44A|nr:hypothetical protein [Paraburkholderia phytofirmans]